LEAERIAEAERLEAEKTAEAARREAVRCLEAEKVVEAARQEAARRAEAEKAAEADRCRRAEEDRLAIENLKQIIGETSEEVREETPDIQIVKEVRRKGGRGHKCWKGKVAQDTGGGCAEVSRWIQDGGWRSIQFKAAKVHQQKQVLRVGKEHGLLLSFSASARAGGYHPSP
jgi:hypothetical protein